MSHKFYGYNKVMVTTKFMRPILRFIKIRSWLDGVTPRWSDSKSESNHSVQNYCLNMKMHHNIHAFHNQWQIINCLFESCNYLSKQWSFKLKCFHVDSHLRNFRFECFHAESHPLDFGSHSYDLARMSFMKFIEFINFITKCRRVYGLYSIT